MPKIHELTAQFFDGEITALEYRNGVLHFLMQIEDEKELETFASFFIANAPGSK